MRVAKTLWDGYCADIAAIARTVKHASSLLSGHLRQGDRIPLLRVLEDRYKIAIGTARSSERLLRVEGHVHTTQGRGTFVTDTLQPVAEHT